MFAYDFFNMPYGFFLGFTSIATFFDFMVWKTGKSLNFYTDNAFFPVSKKSADEKDQEAEK